MISDSVCMLDFCRHNFCEQSVAILATGTVYNQMLLCFADAICLQRKINFA
jgi:hypothetical protein